MAHITQSLHGMTLRRLTIILMICFAALAAVSTVAIGVVVEYFAENSLRPVIQFQLMEESFRARDGVLRVVQERYGDLRVISEAARAGGCNPAQISRQIAFTRRSFPVYLSLSVTGADGRILAEEGSASLPADVAWHEGPAMQDRGRLLVSEVFSASSHHGQAVGLQLRRPREAEQEELTVHAVMDTGPIAQLLSSAAIGATGELLLVNAKGVFLTPSRLGGAALKDRVAYLEGASFQSPSGFSRHIDYRGKEVIAAYSSLSPLPWLVIAEQDTDETFGTIDQLRHQLLILLLGMLVGVTALSYALARTIVRRLDAAYRQRKELEARMAQQDKLASMGLLTAGVAHELNTPLANALLYAQILKEELPANDFPRLERLAVIEEQISLCAGIVRSLLEYSHTSREKDPACDIADVIERLLRIVRATAEARGVVVHDAVPDNLPLLAADAGSVQQVLMNLIGNALEAMQGGGTLRITARHVPILEKVKIDVGDTGPGIPRRLQDDIFHPFYTTKKKGQGTGLGLFVSYGIVRQLGGALHVHSVSAEDAGPGFEGPTGTLFTIELPVRRDLMSGSPPFSGG